MPDLRMRADQMRFYDRICKFKIAAFVLHICTTGHFVQICISWRRQGSPLLPVPEEEQQVHLDQGVRRGVPQAEGVPGQSPVLCKPQPGTPLRLYFALTERAISSVLVQEQDQVQKAIYFVTKILQGPEVRYQALEKATLAVVFSARRLRHYFQSFTAVVMT